MNLVQKREAIVELFKSGSSPYAISMNISCSIKEVYHYLKDNNALEKEHRRGIKAKRDLDKSSH